MSDKLEGTIILEGLIEGPMPPFPDARARLEKWAQGFTGGVIRINVQFDANHFSALPANEPVAVRALSRDGLDPSNVIADGLADLLRSFPPLERSQAFSTIRSVEYRSQQEVQTLYAVGPDGRPATRQQIVPCDTVKPPEPLGRRELIKNGVIGVLLACVVVGISTFFIPYGRIWRQLTSGTERVATTVEPGAFLPYFSVQVTALDLRDGMLRLTVSRTALYPQDEAAFDALYNDPPAMTRPAITPATTSSAATAAATTSAATATQPAAPIPVSLLRRRVAIESLAKGSVRLEYYDKAGKAIGDATLRVDILETKAVVDCAVPAPVVDRQIVAPARIVLVPQ